MEEEKCKGILIESEMDQEIGKAMKEIEKGRGRKMKEIERGREMKETRDIGKSTF